MASFKPLRQEKREQAASKLKSSEHIICALSYYINHFPAGQYKPHVNHGWEWRWPLWTARRMLGIRALAGDTFQMCLPRYWARNLDKFGLSEVRWNELNPDLCLEDFTIIEFANNHKRLLSAVRAWLRGGPESIPLEAKTITPQRREIPAPRNQKKENKLNYDSLPSETKRAIWDRLKEMQ